MRNHTKERKPHDTTVQIRAQLIRNKIAADWQIVHEMLTGERRRRAPDGRDVYEIWADIVLENPPAALAFMMERILPKPLDEQGVNPQLTSIQNLYLTAIQAANQMPAPKAIEHESDTEW
jgi:hypothetical protein